MGTKQQYCTLQRLQKEKATCMASLGDYEMFSIGTSQSRRLSELPVHCFWYSATLQALSCATHDVVLGSHLALQRKGTFQNGRWSRIASWDALATLLPSFTCPLHERWRLLVIWSQSHPIMSGNSPISSHHVTMPFLCTYVFCLFATLLQHWLTVH